MSQVVEVTLKVKAPFLTGNRDEGDLLTDASMVRNADGAYVFPESLMRGVLRDSLYSMAQLCDFKLLGEDSETIKTALFGLFGVGSGDVSDGSAITDLGTVKASLEPKARKAVFSDLACTEMPSEESQEVKTRVKIDDVTGASDEAQLQFTSMAGVHGQEFPFAMTITLPQGMDADLCRKLIDLALRPITALGSSKSAGFGRIAGQPTVRLVEAKGPATSVFQFSQPDATSEYADIALQVHGPFLLDTVREAGNALSGGTVISGGTIKAALFEALPDLADDDKAILSAVRITHAFCAPIDPDIGAVEKSKTMCAALPLSLAYYEGGPVLDLAHCAGTPLLSKKIKTRRRWF
ncbi:MAG: RAMP superfamily CRISPR-associated protein [Pseudomonadota bacterium]